MASNTDLAPWCVIRSDDKKRARLNCIRYILSQVEYSNRTKDDIFKIDEDILISGTREIEIMEQDNKFSRNAE